MQSENTQTTIKSKYRKNRRRKAQRKKAKKQKQEQDAQIALKKLGNRLWFKKSSDPTGYNIRIQYELVKNGCNKDDVHRLYGGVGNIVFPINDNKIYVSGGDGERIVDLYADPQSQELFYTKVTLMHGRPQNGAHRFSGPIQLNKSEFMYFGGYNDDDAYASNNLVKVNMEHSEQPVIHEVLNSIPRPSPRCAHAGCKIVNGSDMYYFIHGGWNPRMLAFLKDAWVYDLQKNRWMSIKYDTGKSAPSKRCSHTCCTLPIVESDDSNMLGRVLIFAGWNDELDDISASQPNKRFNDMWIGTIYKGDDKYCTINWQQIYYRPGPCPAPRQLHSAVMLNATTRPHMLVYGGETDESTTREVWIYDVLDNRWTDLSQIFDNKECKICTSRGQTMSIYKVQPWTDNYTLYSILVYAGCGQVSKSAPEIRLNQLFCLRLLLPNRGSSLPTHCSSDTSKKLQLNSDYSVNQYHDTTIFVE